ncbi:MAG: nitroreductase [Dehalococcoidia bacterium]
MELYEAIRGRRDLEASAPEAPSREVIERLLDAATWAPNHRHTEPWRFHVLAGTGRDAIADAIAAWAAANAMPEGIGTSARSKLLRAPVALFVTQIAADTAEREREDYAACWCALQNLLLAAHAEGLAAHLSTGGILTYEATRTHLGLAPGEQVVSLVNIGLPRADAPAKVGARNAPVVRWDWR